jgi:flagellar motor switch protein FliN/FliY
MPDDTRDNTPDAAADEPSAQRDDATTEQANPAPDAPDDAGMPEGDLDALLETAEDTIAQTRRAITDEPGEAASSAAAPKSSRADAIATAPGAPASFPELSGNGASDSLSNLDLLDDVELDVKIELGRAEMYVEDVLRLGVGSVVELDKLAGDPVDVYVNDRLVARGEVLVLNDNFCVRVNEILSPGNEAENSA